MIKNIFFNTGKKTVDTRCPKVVKVLKKNRSSIRRPILRPVFHDISKNRSF